VRGTKLKTQSSDERLERLKELLLAPELETLRKVERALRALELRCDDPDDVIRRVTPVIDRILRDSFAHKDAHTLRVLAEYLADIIHEASEHDLPTLSRSLQHVIGPAIAKEIADNRDAMVDTLYPIMGGMISKYVTQAIKELMENINRKIEQGLSTERIKRKIKAKLTGVSETELLLEESADARILALFVIHKPTGLLIASAQLEENVIDDPHMVAAMASAVKDFLNDSMPLQHDVKEEIQILSYADATLYIESAGSVYLVAFLDNEPDYELRGKINAFFADVVKKYADFFREFDGDESHPKVARLNEKLDDFLQAQPNLLRRRDKTAPKANPAKWILGTIGAVAAAVLAYNGWQSYRMAQLEKEALRFGVTDARLIEANATAYRLEGTVRKYNQAQKAAAVLSRLLQRPVVPHVTLDARTLWERNRALESQLMSLQQRLKRLQNDQTSTERIAHIQQHLRTLSDENALLRRKLVALNEELQTVRRKLDALRHRKSPAQHIREDLRETMRNDPYFDATHAKLNFASLQPFAPMQTVMAPSKQQRFLQSAQRYLQTLCPYASYIAEIRIDAYSDTSGSEEKNLELTRQRAQYAKTLLEEHNLTACFAPQSIKATGYGERYPVIRHGKEDADASRRIEITYRLKPSAKE